MLVHKFFENISSEARHIVLKMIPSQRTKPVDAENSATTVRFMICNVRSDLSGLGAEDVLERE